MNELPMKRIVAALLAVGVSSLATAAHAASGQQIANSGTSGAPACSSCHGDQGEGQPSSGFPRLAGLNAQYLEHQLSSFKDGTRKNDIMQPIAAALTDDERNAVAEYYAGLHPPKAEEALPDKALVAAGAALAAVGDWPKGLPGCSQCHGAGGLGVGHAFPQLAGQSASYIENELQAWKSGDRKNDPMGLMANVAKKLTDDQIKSVAAYYASLPVEAQSAHPEAKP